MGKLGLESFQSHNHQNLSPACSLCTLACRRGGCVDWGTERSFSQFTSILSLLPAPRGRVLQGKLNSTTQGSSTTSDLRGILLLLSNHVARFFAGGGSRPCSSLAQLLLLNPNWVTRSLTWNEFKRFSTNELGSRALLEQTVEHVTVISHVFPVQRSRYEWWTSGKCISCFVSFTSTL